MKGRLTLDEAMRLIDRFSDWIYDKVGKQVEHHPEPGRFVVEVVKPRRNTK